MVSSLEKTFPIQASIVKFVARPASATFVYNSEFEGSRVEMERSFDAESWDSASETPSTSSVGTTEKNEILSTVEETNFSMRAGLPADREKTPQKLSVRARTDASFSDDSSCESYSSSDLRRTSRHLRTSVEKRNEYNKHSTQNYTLTNARIPRGSHARTKLNGLNNESSEISSDDSVFSHGSSTPSRTSSSTHNGYPPLPSRSVLDVEEPTAGLNVIVRVILYLREFFALSPLRRKFATLHMRQNSNHEFVDLSSTSPTENRRKRSNSSIKRISFSPLTLLFEAVGEHCISEARSILASEPELNVNSVNASGQSLLHVAASLGGLECVHLLLEYGASVTLKDSEGWTPVHYAIRGGYWKCAILLVEAGSNMAEYAQRRTEEFKRVVELSKGCFITPEVYV